MSLKVDGSSRRARSKSPGRRDDRDRDTGRGRSSTYSSPYDQPVPGELVRMPSPGAGYSYNYDRQDGYGAPGPRDSSYRTASPTDESSYGRYGRPEPEPTDSYGRTRPRYPEGKAQEESPMEQLMRGAEAFLPAKYASKVSNYSQDSKIKSALKKEKLEDDLAYGSSTPMPEPPTTPNAYSRPSYGYPSSAAGSNGGAPSYGSYLADPRASGGSLATSDAASRYAPPTQRMSTLSVTTPHHSAHMSLSSAPPSPLLESYYGTYQSMSPMPSPLLLAANGHDVDIAEPLSPGLSDSEVGGKQKRRARFHDPVDDATRLAKALRGDKEKPDLEPLIEILPGMTHEQIMELRTEYKRLVKTGAERKGVNVAKHIRSRLKEMDPNLMKACYTTALGKWESEAYWANFWYQGDKTRRELLIEALMGRSNEEIYEIKEAFSDKKYRNSLTTCMKTELKEDKFKRAVLMALEGRRMEEKDQYGRPMALDMYLVEKDADTLINSVRKEKGGETSMLEIVIMRSDSHLREVLRECQMIYDAEYEREFEKYYGRKYERGDEERGYKKIKKRNFTRDILEKSGNLVGEVLTHIIHGVIKKPVRDAQLLNHALTTSKNDELRRELLTSRLVRLHWDRKHMARVKQAYRDHYHRDLAEDVEENTRKTSHKDWGLFCEQLAVTRMSDEVKVVERIHSRERTSDREREREREREEQRAEEEQRLRTREREMDRRAEKERREKEKEMEKERARDEKKRHRSNTLEVGGSGRSREKSRERSRSRRRD